MIPSKPNRPRPRHPGRILREDFLRHLPDTAQADVADRLGMSRPRVNELLREKRGITPDTAMRLARAFGTTAEFWMEAQAAWDLHLARQSWRRLREIEQIEPWIEPRAEDAAVPDLPAAANEAREVDALLSLPVEIARLADAAVPPAADGIRTYYERFLEKRGLLADAQRYARIQAQVDALSPAQPESPRPVRTLRVSPALFPRRV